MTSLWQKITFGYLPRVCYLVIINGWIIAADLLGIYFIGINMSTSQNVYYDKNLQKRYICIVLYLA